MSDEIETTHEIQLATEVHTVEEVRQRVERALSYVGRPQDSRLRRFAGQLSTEPRRVGRFVTAESLFSECDSLSYEVWDSLRSLLHHRQQASLVSSAEATFNPHLYITIPLGAEEVLVDPTIGQVVEGYNHVFVGARTQLKELVGRTVSRRRAGNYKIYREYEELAASGKLFAQMWGEKSKIIPARQRASYAFAAKRH